MSNGWFTPHNPPPPPPSATADYRERGTQGHIASDECLLLHCQATIRVNGSPGVCGTRGVPCGLNVDDTGLGGGAVHAQSATGTST